MVRFIHNGISLGSPTPSAWYWDEVQIIEYDQTFNRIKVDPSELPDTLVGTTAPFAETQEEQTGTFSDGFLLEIYTPLTNSENSFFYEVGEIRDIANGFHMGSMPQDVQDQTANAPAIIVVENGAECFTKTRKYNINGNKVPFLVEDPNMSDQYESKCTDLGRANLEYRAELTSESVSGQISQQRNEGKLVYSEQFDETTLLNRTGTVYSLNFRQVDQTFGDVQHIHSEGDKIDVYQKDRVAMIYVDRKITTSINGDAQVIQSSDTVLSDYQYYGSENGISDFPTSFASHANRRYFVDASRGEVIRKSTDGMTVISDYGMQGYFNTILKRINDNGGEIVGWYDIRFDEYVLNLKYNSTVSVTPSDYIGAGATEARAGFDSSVYTSQFVVGASVSFSGVSRSYTGTIIAVNSSSIDVDLGLSNDKTEFLADTVTSNVLVSETLAFNENVRGWVTFYGYIPDWADSGTIDMVSWKEGQLYTHNRGDYNNFYGEDFTSSITFIGNETPATKFFKAVQIKAQGIDYGEQIVSSPEISTSLGQSSNLIEQDYAFKEGALFSGLWKDENTPNVTHPLLNGDTLRGRWISFNIQLQSGVNKLVKILQATVNYENSSETY